MQEEYVRQPDSHKRINSDIPGGPRKQINYNQVTTVQTKESSIKIPQYPATQDVHNLTTPARALLLTSTSMKTSVRTGATYEAINHDKSKL